MRTAVLPDPRGNARDARIAAAGVDLCRRHAGAWNRSYVFFHSWPYRGGGDVPASRARVLFLSLLDRGLVVADVPASAHGARGVSIAGALNEEKHEPRRTRVITKGLVSVFCGSLGVPSLAAM